MVCIISIAYIKQSKPNMAVIDLTDSNMGTVDKNVHCLSRLVNSQVKIGIWQGYGNLRTWIPNWWFIKLTLSLFLYIIQPGRKDKYKKDPSFLLYPILLYWINYCIESKFGLNRSKKSDQITFGCLLKMNIKKRKVMYSKRFHWIGKTVLCKTQVSYCLLYSFIYFNSKLWSSLQTFNSIHTKKKKKGQWIQMNFSRFKRVSGV